MSEEEKTNVRSILEEKGLGETPFDLSIKENENNTVDLIYDIDLGKKALIQKVRFVGDKIYKDRKLRRVITTEEAKFWKFLSSNKYLNEKKILLDQRLLRNFYLNKGFYQIKVTNSHAQMVDENYFVVTFNINAGKKFKFNNLSLDLPQDYERKKFKDIEKELNKLKNEYYSLGKVEKVLDEIEKLALFEQYEFINASIEENIVDSKIDLKIFVSESKEKYYVLIFLLLTMFFLFFKQVVNDENSLNNH